jgi:hypothetical protein
MVRNGPMLNGLLGSDGCGLNNPIVVSASAFVVGIADTTGGCRNPFQHKGFCESERRVLPAARAETANHDRPGKANQST